MASSFTEKYARRSYYFLSEVYMRDENEKKIFKAIEGDDVETLKRILTNPIVCRLGRRDIPILSVAVLKGARDVVKFLIEIGCDLDHVDENGNTAFHLLVWMRYNRCVRPKSDTDTFLLLTSCANALAKLDVSDTSLASCSSNALRSKSDIADTLLTSSSNALDAVIGKANKNKLTPFMLSCDTPGCDMIISRFLSLLENMWIPIKRFIGSEGNCFHYYLNSFTSCSPTVETVQAMVDKISFSARLIDGKNENGNTPLQQLLDRNKCRETASEVAKIFFRHGASIGRLSWAGLTDTSFLDLAISQKNKSLIEVVLRSGYSNHIYRNETALFIILKYWRGSKTELIRIIELFLAFGYDLHKALFLYSIDYKSPTGFVLPVMAYNIDRHIVEALRELRRSNILLSLQRQCRNTIRRHLKGKADVVIGNLTCIPDRIKSFLLVENEQPLLQISE